MPDNRLLKRLKALLVILPLCAAGLHTGCEGTSSGVDNPGLAELDISFRNADGAAVRVTGDLDVYGKDQNPALNPTPLATVRINNSALTNLTAKDFERINAATKRSAAVAEAPSAAGKVDFNIIFRSDKDGSLAFGMAFDPEAAAFARDGMPVERVVLQPKPLARFQARLSSEASFGGLGRIFIPGTPFQATLADSSFAFEALPEGTFNLQLLGGDGKIYAVRESLDTKVNTVSTYTTGKDPVGNIDTSDTTMPPAFSVSAPDSLEAVVGLATVLEGKLIGLEAGDARASILWRQLRNGGSPDTALIVAPTRLSTQVKFKTAGSYSIELSVTAGTHTARDTVECLVRAVHKPESLTILLPRPGDSVTAGKPYKITWQTPRPGKAVIFLSTDGMSFDTLAAAVPSEGDPAVYSWTPSDTLTSTRNAYLRIRMHEDTSLVATMAKPFTILGKAPRDTSGQ